MLSVQFHKPAMADLDLLGWHTYPSHKEKVPRTCLNVSLLTFDDNIIMDNKSICGMWYIIFRSIYSTKLLYVF